MMTSAPRPAAIRAAFTPEVPPPRTTTRPGKTPGTPKFLIDAGVKLQSYDYSHNNGKSLSPDYEDPRMRAALADFIAAFGAKYDGDARLGFITRSE